MKLNGDIIDELVVKVKILENEKPRNNLDDKVKDLEEKQTYLIEENINAIPVTLKHTTIKV